MSIATRIKTGCGRIPHLLSAIASLAMLGTGALAADTAKLADIDARYQAERAACDSAAILDRAACLRDAAAARDEARRGVLNGTQADYEKNALARCAALPIEERDLCIRRTRNEGETSGSVGEGGIYREYRELDLPSVAPPK
ncbi:MAG TPA: hypothetical protein VGE12_14440 [Noviherbaspirillum sp.]